MSQSMVNRKFLMQAYGFSAPSAQNIETAINCCAGKTSQLKFIQWRSPACDRTKDEIIRWHRTGYWGYSIVEHHDHSGSMRFDNAFICDDCNKVDAKVKVLAKKELRKSGVSVEAYFWDWSFSVKDIRSVVISTPHRRHGVDLELSKKIVKTLWESFA
jgi:hypothetical protein